MRRVSFREGFLDEVLRSLEEGTVVAKVQYHVDKLGDGYYFSKTEVKKQFAKQKAEKAEKAEADCEKAEADCGC